MMPERILVVDDEMMLVEGLTFVLEQEGYTVAAAYDGQEALDKARTEKPDLIVLDLMLPKISGLDVCRVLRRETNVPILMLTAKGEEMDKVVGLELGADDYVVKPFGIHELIARIRALLRRAAAPAEEEERIMVDDLMIDFARHEVSVRGELIALAPKEFEVLAMLARRQGRAVRREVLLEQIWGPDFYGDERTLDVHIRWLREKIEEDPSRPTYLLTVRGVGYKMKDRGFRVQGSGS